MNNHEINSSTKWMKKGFRFLMCALLLIHIGCGSTNNNAEAEKEILEQYPGIVELMNQGKLSEADAQLDSMKKAVEKSNRQKYLYGWWYILKGQVNYNKGLKLRGRDDLSKAVNILQRDGTKPFLIGSAFYKYADILYRLGEIKESELNIDSGLKVLADFGDTNEEVVRFRIKLVLLKAEIAESVEDLNKAESSLREARDMLEGVPDAEYEAVYFSALSGILNLKQGHLPDADVYFSVALKLIHKNKLERSVKMGVIFYYLGELNYELERYDDAVKYLQEAIKIFKSGHPQDEASIRLAEAYLGMTYVRKKAYSKALSCYSSIIDSLKSLPELSSDQKDFLKNAIEAKDIILKGIAASSNSGERPMPKPLSTK